MILGTIWSNVTDSQTLLLVAVIVLIMIFSALLEKSGQLDRIVSSFQRVSPGPRFTLAAMPALIGLLPMPGGALFSAPMVEAAMGKRSVGPELKVAINYWFRHVWEYWWPLYPGIILAASLFSPEGWKVIAAQSLLTIGALAGGVLFILSGVPKLVAEPTDRQPPGRWSAFAAEITPIAVVILIFGGLQALVEGARLLIGFAGRWPSYNSLFLGLVIAIGLVMHRGNLGYAGLRDTILNSGIASIVMIVFAVMAFKGMLIESKAIEQVRWDLAQYHIPPVVMAALLPFVAGMVVGLAVGFVGSSFPLVVALIPPGESAIPYGILAFGFGFMGMMLSPVHLCMLVSRQYFCADFFLSYHYLWRPALLGISWTIFLFVLFKELTS
jgi:integral membrane protein (TIGR00529 family)